MKEIRSIDSNFRAYKDEESDEEKKYIEGYAFMFNRESKDLGGFTEIIQREAVENVDMNDVVALFNHNSNFVLARKNETVSTLHLEIDDLGLKYRFEVDDEISYQKDLYRNMVKGNISKSSFAFYLPKDGSGERWEKSDGKYLRHITQFYKITDVSVVTNPAYEQTVSLARSLDEIKLELDISYIKGEEIENLPAIETVQVEDLIYRYHNLK